MGAKTGLRGSKTMTIGESIKSVYSKFVTISGRAPRSEFWWFMLYYVGVGIVLDFIFPPLASIWDLVHFIPLITVTARRLHDTDRSGWWQVMPFVAVPLLIYGSIDFLSGPLAVAGVSDIFTTTFIIGLVIFAATYIVLIVWCATAGTKGPNRFGEDPFGHSDVEVFD